MTAAKPNPSGAALETRNDGAVLSATFDTTSSTFAYDVKAFGAKLAELQTKLGFSAFVRAVKQDGQKLIVKIIPARPGEASTSLGSLMEELHSEAGAFEAGAPREPGRRPVVDVNATIPEPSDDPALNNALKKGLLIPRR